MKLARFTIAAKPNAIDKETKATGTAVHSGRAVRKRKRSIWLKLAIVLILLISAAGGYFYWQAQQTPAVATTIAVPVVQGNLEVTVESSGSVQPNQSLLLAFKQVGEITEVLVQAGDVVTKGQVLGRIDDGDLRLKLQKAEIDLQSAQEKLADLQEAPTADEITAAQAAVESAQANLDDAKEAPTAQDISTARTNLQLAQTKLAAAKAGPTALELANADAALKSAKEKLANLQAGASTQELTSAQNAVTIAQDKLTNVKAGASKADLAVADANVQSAQAKIDSLKARGASSADLATAQANLLKAQESLAALKARPTSAELAQAQGDSDSAKAKLAALKAGPSAAELASAQAAVLQAQTNFDTLKAGPDAQKIADAQGAVDKAQSTLDTLLAGPDKGKIADAQVKLSQAQTNLEKLTTPAGGSTLASAQLAVAQAQSSLDQARVALEHAKIVAPFDGVVSKVSAVVGDNAQPNSAAIVLNDNSSMHLDIDLSESDVANVQKGQSANLTFDAITGQTITGTVTSVASVATSSNNVVTYLVQVGFNPGDAPVKVGMSANAAIVVDSREGVMQVPSRAIQSLGRNKSVRVLYGENKTPVTVRVETGLTNGTMTEIVSCLDTNNQCLRTGDTVAVNVTATNSTGRNAGPDQFIFGGGQFGGQTVPIGPGGPGFTRRQGP
jgi:HlyD family secretion protein